MSYEAHRAVLVLGGIRSGKSEYAESLVSRAAEVRYVATAAGSPGDSAWAGRVAEHLARRPEAWLTEETGTDPGRLAELLADAKPDQTLLVDDLGGWVAALPSGDFAGALGTLVGAVRDCAGRVVLVSPEVGLSVHPPTEAGIAFADALGTTNRALAEVCDSVVLVVAGQPVTLKRGVPGGRVIPVTSRVALGPATVVAAPVLPEDAEPVVETGMSLPIPDHESMVAATERLLELDVPGTGLGRLAEVVGFVAGAQGSPDPQPYRSVRVLLLHGVHEGGLAAGDDPAEWERRLGQVAEGGGPLGLLATAVGGTGLAGAGGTEGTSLQLADPAAAGLPAAAPVEDGDALSADRVEAALRYGWRLAESAADSGTDLLVLAAGGPGQEAAAVAVIAANTGTEAPALLPRVRLSGGRFDDLAWMARCAAIRDALHRSNGLGRQPKEILGALGGADLAAAVGVLLGAAARRTPVLIDGPVGVAAGLVARDLAGESRLWLLLADHGGHPAVRRGADMLSLTPVTELGLSLGEGAAALTVLPVIQSALLLASGAAPPPVSTMDSALDRTDPETVRA
jgi:adenosyl cobinamide kinase/adenosyl cobinamide phosphate guanylyltransferase/NaMN:DMB phosphoribosyltransferase